MKIEIGGKPMKKPIAWKSITAILCLTAIEITALLKGINGVLLAAVIAAVAGLGGYVVAKKE